MNRCSGADPSAKVAIDFPGIQVLAPVGDDAALDEAQDAVIEGLCGPGTPNGSYARRAGTNAG